AYEDLCAELGEQPADVALAWLLTRPAVTAPIIGPRTIEQLTGSLRVLEIELDDATLDRLDELFPAPFPKGSKPAPEAYACERPDAAPTPRGRARRGGRPRAGCGVPVRGGRQEGVARCGWRGMHRVAVPSSDGFPAPG